MNSKIQVSKRQQISKIIEKGQALQNKIIETHDELSQHLSGSKSTSLSHVSQTAQIAQPQPQQLQQLQPQKAVAPPKPSYQLLAQEKKMQLDSIEQLIKTRRNRSSVVASQDSQKPVDQSKDTAPVYQIELKPAASCCIRIHSIRVLAREPPRPPAKLSVEVFSDVQGVFMRFDVDLFTKHNAPLFQRIANDTFLVAVNRAVNVAFSEGDGFGIRVNSYLQHKLDVANPTEPTYASPIDTNRYKLTQSYSKKMRSQYPQLMSGQQQYYLKADEIEFLDTSSAAVQLTDHTGRQVVDISSVSLLQIVPTAVELDAIVSASNQIDLDSNGFEDLLLANERLFAEKMTHISTVSKAVQTGTTDKFTEFNGFLVDENGEVYESTQQKQKVVYQQESQPQMQNIQTQPRTEYVFNEPVQSLLPKQQLLQRPTLFIKRLELDCLAHDTTVLKSIDIVFENRTFTVARDQIVVGGHVLLTNLTLTIPVTSRQVSPIIVKADHYVGYLPLQILKTKPSADIWAGMSRTGRAGVSLSCLPPICLSCDKYQFLDKDSEVISDIPHQNLNGEEVISREAAKMTASQVVQMYRPLQREVLVQQEYPVVRQQAFGGQTTLQQAKDIVEIVRDIQAVQDALGQRNDQEQDYTQQQRKNEIQNERGQVNGQQQRRDENEDQSRQVVQKQATKSVGNGQQTENLELSALSIENKIENALMNSEVIQKSIRNSVVKRAQQEMERPQFKQPLQTKESIIKTKLDQTKKKLVELAESLSDEPATEPKKREIVVKYEPESESEQEPQQKRSSSWINDQARKIFAKGIDSEESGSDV